MRDGHKKSVGIPGQVFERDCFCKQCWGLECPQLAAARQFRYALFMHVQDSWWNLPFIEPAIQIKVLREQAVRDRREVDAMIDGAFECQRVFAIAEQKRTHDDPVTKNDLDSCAAAARPEFPGIAGLVRL